MKKILIIASIIILIIISNKEYDKLLIPDNSIRIRVIANSNNIEDQLQKIKVKEEIEKEIYTNLKDATNIADARQKIEKSIPKLNLTIKNTIKNDDFSINYGDNFFPDKELNGIQYKQGNYESLVINLGEAKGNNWWCVLFPPLCTIEVKENDTNFVEYKSKVLEILKDYK